MTAPAWAVFLDRDGTLVPDARHPTRPAQLRFYRNTPVALRVLRDAGARTIVVSNQSAVARGLLDPEGLARLDRRLRALAAAAGAPLTDAIYCPHHPDFTGVCSCRKPAPGMIQRALRKHRLQPERCFLIGDTVSDLRAARAVGITPVLVLTGHGRRSRGEAERGRLAATVVRDVAAAARWIVGRRIESPGGRIRG